MEIQVNTQAQVQIIKLHGRLSLGEPVDRLRETVDGLLSGGAVRLLIDLQDVPMVDSSGIGLLVRSLSAAKQQGGALKLLNPSKYALQTLKLVGLLTLFEVFEDQQVAITSFG